jgi:hypothetical protein
MLVHTQIPDKDRAPNFDAFGADRTAVNPRTQGSGELSDGVLEIPK